MANRLFRGATAKVFLQETSTQLDSISNSADTTEASAGQGVEVIISNNLSQYITSDGNILYFEGPQDITIKIKQLVLEGELLSALIGQDSLSGSTFTITTFTQFLPRLTIHVQLDQAGGQQLNLNLTNCVFSNGTLTTENKALVMNNVEIQAEGFGTVDWNTV